ncbi:hypothetical protein BGX30_001811, partial [Mortierella sp. GBA39]
AEVADIWNSITSDNIYDLTDLHGYRREFFQLFGFETDGVDYEADRSPGTKEVPNHAYYGIQTLRAKENFPITGQRLHPELIRSMAMVKKAAALANMEIKRLLPAKVIANRALELMGKEKGSYADISPNNHVNMAQSTNDSFPTAVHLATLTMIDKLVATMTDLHQAFVDKANEFDAVIKMGRTHLQDAVPIRLGQEFQAYARVLGRDIERVKATKNNLLHINMGATAVGTGLNADLTYIKRVAEILAELSGFPVQAADHLVDATQNTDAYTEVSAALKICMMNMSKVANDIRLMASGPRAGLGELSLPSRQPGSSIMPGKVNPVMCEVINQIAFQVIGNDHTICLASEAGQLELNVMEPVLVYNLLQSLEIMNQGFRVFREHCVEGIQANVERCREYVENSVGIITALNPHLGYEVVSRIAREAITTGKSVRELCLLYNVLTEEELNIILDPYQMTNPGIAGEALLRKE